MNELTATQKTILEAAIGNLNGSINPLPSNINGGAAKKVIKSMLKNGLIEEDEAASQPPAFVDEPDPDYWAIAIKQFPNLTRMEWPPIRHIIEDAYMLGYNAKPARRPKASHDSKTPRQPRTDSKQARVLELMRRPEGASLAQIADATEWQLHTIRAFISTSKKKGMEITTNQVRTVGPNQQGSSGSTTTYFIN